MQNRVFISIHAPREGSDLGKVRIGQESIGISIHAPREGSDELVPVVFDDIGISIHAPREGSDLALSVSAPARR